MRTIKPPFSSQAIPAGIDNPVTQIDEKSNITCPGGNKAKHRSFAAARAPLRRVPAVHLNPCFFGGARSSFSMHLKLADIPSRLSDSFRRSTCIFNVLAPGALRTPNIHHVFHIRSDPALSICLGARLQFAAPRV